jgi:hypothetical protein
MLAGVATDLRHASDPHETFGRQTEGDEKFSEWFKGTLARSFVSWDEFRKKKKEVFPLPPWGLPRRLKARLAWR